MRAQIIKKSQQWQNKIDQQGSWISSLEVQNQKLTPFLEPKFLVDMITQAVTSNLNISVGNKPSNTSNGLSGYYGKPYLEKPRPLQLALGIDGSLNPELSCLYCKDTNHLKENCNIK